MTWDELSPEQKLDMKKAYMEKLAESPTDNSLFTPEFVHEWCNVMRGSEKLPLPVYGAYEVNLRYGITWTLDKIQDLCDRFSKGQLTKEERKLLPQEKL